MALEKLDLYIVREVKPDIYEIANFVDGTKEPYSIYNVRRTTKSYSCDCPGFWRQKNKPDHKHCRIVKFWVENLEKTFGCAMWFDGDDIEYHRFADERLEKWLLLMKKCKR